MLLATLASARMVAMAAIHADAGQDLPPSR